MYDRDVVIIGGGPAGLTCGLYLARGKFRAILLDKENFGGPIKDYELIENYPGYAQGISGARLASGMVAQAAGYGLEMKIGQVTGIETFKNCHWVNSADGSGYTARVVVIAGGARHKKLTVLGEDEFQGKGVFQCAFCDGGQFQDRVVAVAGGGDAGITEALYLTKLASRVVIIETEPELTATSLLRERALAHSKLEVRYGVRIVTITGDSTVRSIELEERGNGGKSTLAVDGVLVQVGLEPDTDYLTDVVPLSESGHVLVNPDMETEVPFILACGDIRSDSPGQIATAVGDGAIAAITAQRLLLDRE